MFCNEIGRQDFQNRQISGKLADCAVQFANWPDWQIGQNINIYIYISKMRMAMSMSSHHCTKVRFIPNVFETFCQSKLMTNDQKQCR